MATITRNCLLSKTSTTQMPSSMVSRLWGVSGGRLRRKAGYARLEGCNGGGIIFYVFILLVNNQFAFQETSKPLVTTKPINTPRDKSWSSIYAAQ